MVERRGDPRVQVRQWGRGREDLALGAAAWSRAAAWGAQTLLALEAVPVGESR